MLKEVIAASKYTNPKNRHYSEDWLLLCLLSHIRSSGAYKFLRYQQLLLPSTTTIRKYVSIIKTDCGFDDQFFKLLKKRMGKKTNEQRYGVLLCVCDREMAPNKPGTSGLGVKRSYKDGISSRIFNTEWIEKCLCIEGKKSRPTCLYYLYLCKP